MKNTSLLLLCLLKSVISGGQAPKYGKLEILLIGTSHQASAKIQQDTSGIMGTVNLFQPDAIAVEIIPAWDSVSLRNYRSKYIAMNDSILKTQGWTKTFVNNRINALTAQLTFQAGQHQSYDSLAFYYMLTGDVYGNSAYNWYAADKLSAVTGSWQSIFSKTPAYKWTQGFINGSEFNAFIFPFAFYTKCKYLYPVDDQTEALEAVKYQKKTMKSLLFGILKMNFRGFKVMRMIKQQKKEYTEAERNGKAYEFVNTEKFQAQLAELFDNIYPKWSKSKWARLLQQNWNNRNERIARRITAIHLQNKEIKKIVVFIGAAHIPALKKILSNDDEVLSITTFNKQK